MWINGKSCIVENKQFLVNYVANFGHQFFHQRATIVALLKITDYFKFTWQFTKKKERLKEDMTVVILLFGKVKSVMYKINDIKYDKLSQNVYYLNKCYITGNSNEI